MPSSNAGKPSAWLPLLLIFIALAGFLGTTYWTQNREFEQLNRSLTETRNSLLDQITEQNDLLNKRYMSLMKISQEVSVHETVLNEVQQKIRTQKTDIDTQIAKMDSSVRMMRDEQAAVVSVLDQRVDTLTRKTEQQNKTLQNIKLAVNDNVEGKNEQLTKLEKELRDLRVLVNSQAREIRTLKSNVATSGYNSTATTASTTPTLSPTTSESTQKTETTSNYVPDQSSNRIRYSWNDIKDYR
ncbi:MAG: hypothetical protein AAF984_01330 [Verrucomicrobiota bacterium]